MTHPQQIDDFDFRRFVKNERYSGINREERHYAAVLLTTNPATGRRSRSRRAFQHNPEVKQHESPGRPRRPGR